MAAGLAGLALIFLGDHLAPPPGQFLGGLDVVGQLIQGLGLLHSELSAGRWPVWNPYLASGLPLWANPQLGLLYPPNWILLAVPWELGISLMTAFHLFWISFGTYVWARTLGFVRAGAVVGGLVMAYNGMLAVRAADGHPNFAASLAWLPWVLAALERSFGRRTARSALLAGVPLALCLLAGNPAGGVLVAGLAAIWTAAEVVAPRAPAAGGLSRWLFPVRQLALAGAAAAALSAAQLLPTAELIGRSVRSSPSYEFASQYSLPLAHLITWLLPGFFGEPVRLGYWGEFGYNEFMLYPGLLTLWLAGAALRFGNVDRRVRWWGLIGVVGLLVALGPAGGLHPLLYGLLPPIRLVRSPARFGVYALFALATLAAWAVDHFWRHPAQRFGSLRSWALLLGVPGTLGVVAMLFYTLMPREDARAYHAGAALLGAGLFAGLAGALLLWRPRLSAPVFGSLAAALMIADLWGFGVRQLHLTPRPQDPVWQGTARLLPPAAEAPHRVLPWTLKLEVQNLGMEVGLASTSAYDPLVLADYRAFVDSVADPRATTFDLLNAEYLIIPPDDPQWKAEPSFTLLGQAGGYDVFQRTRALPRAWVAPVARPVRDLAEALAIIHAPGFDPRAEALVTGANCPPGAGGAARVVRFLANQVVVETDAGGVLVLSEVWYPGWSARVDGQPAALLRADGVLRGVCLAPGAHTVVFSFTPPLIALGLGVSAVTLLLAAVLAIWPAKRLQLAAATDDPKEEGPQPQ